MKKLKYPDEFYQVVRQFLGTCPVDKENTCNIYRSSDTSVTMMCRKCGLHFSVTWKSLADSLGKKADAIADQEDKEKEYEALSRAFEILDQNVSTIGIFRHDASKLFQKRLLKKILKSKLL